MSTHPLAPRDKARRLRWRGAVSLLALALGLTACAGGSPSSTGTESSTQKSAMLLRIADETDAGGDPATAASLYRQLHETSPNDPVPLARLGNTLLRTGDYRSAAVAYRAALMLDHNNADFHRGLALALLLASDSEGALSELRLALQQRGDDPRLYNLLGVAQDMGGHHDVAQQTYRHGLEIAPANLGLRNNYAMSLALAGDYADAVKQLSGIAGPESAPRYRLNLALAYGLAGDDTKAAATAREVLDEASVQSNLADYALLRGMDEAQRTAAIIGSELHGTAVSLASAKPAPSYASLPLPTPQAGAAPPGPQATLAPTEAPVAPPAPVAVVAAPAPPPPVPQVAADPASAAPPEPNVAAHASHDRGASAAPPTAYDGDATPAASPQSRATINDDSLARQIVAFLGDHLAVPATTVAQPASPEPVTHEIATFLDAHLPLPDRSDASPADSSFVAPASAAISERSAGDDLAGLPEVTVTASRVFEADASASSGADRYTVQLGSFLSEAAAQHLADDYASKGIAATLSRFNDGDGRTWFVVRAGEFASAEEARNLRRTIQSMGTAAAIVVHHHPAADSKA